MFSISGTFHQLTSWQLHAECGTDLADVQFFGLIAAAMFFEAGPGRLLQIRYKIDAKPAAIRRIPTPLVHFRPLGFIWVMGVFLWAFPMAYYRRVECIIHQQATGRH
jgi:hypothetical protein